MQPGEFLRFASHQRRTRRTAGRRRSRGRSHAVRGRRLPGTGAIGGHRPAATGRDEFRRTRLVGGDREMAPGCCAAARTIRALHDARTRTVCLPAGAGTRRRRHLGASPRSGEHRHIQRGRSDRPGRPGGSRQRGVVCRRSICRRGRMASSTTTRPAIQDEKRSLLGRYREGHWDLCSEADFNGTCVTLGPGKYPRSGVTAWSVEPFAATRQRRAARRPPPVI